MTTLTVDLGSRSYPIFIAQGLMSSLAETLAQLEVHGQVGLVSTARIFDLYGGVVESALTIAGSQVTTALVPDGEPAKNLATVSTLDDTFLGAGLDRSSTLVALGGGVVGDLTGFVAATLFRGIPFVQIPTTLLAMVDASIGGKTGVNHRHGKNLIGAMHQPKAVIIDPNLVKSLPRGELTSSFAEILKAGAIADGSFFHHLAANIEAIIDLADMPLLEEAITKACRIKAQVVSTDELEGDQRRILNFGHTLGHALEAALGYGTLRHGEAVAMGMVGAGYLSTLITGFPPGELNLLTAAVERLDLPKLPPVDPQTVLTFLHRDKKVRHGVPHFVLLKSLGRPVVSSQVTDDQILAALDNLQQRFA